MNEAEFNLGRRKYLNLLKRKKKYLEKKQRYYDLLKEPLIKEYLEVALFLSEHNDEEFEEELLGKKAFDKLAKKTKNSFGFYMYMGKDEDKVLLADIETQRKISVSESSYIRLKKYNCVFYIDNIENKEDFYETKFLEIRDEYLSNLRKLDQEAAKERILKYDKNN